MKQHSFIQETFSGTSPKQFLWKKMLLSNVGNNFFIFLRFFFFCKDLPRTTYLPFLTLKKRLFELGAHLPLVQHEKLNISHLFIEQILNEGKRKTDEKVLHPIVFEPTTSGSCGGSLPQSYYLCPCKPIF